MKFLHLLHNKLGFLHTVGPYRLYFNIDMFIVGVFHKNINENNFI
jgi:hypothetical protein